MKDELDVRELLRNVAAAQALTGPTPRERAAAALDEARRAEAETPGWFDGKPARRLLSYLGPMGRAERVAPRDAAGELLAALAAEDCASLLVLHPVQPAETLAAYAHRCEGAPGWGLAWDSADSARNAMPQRLTVMPADGGAGRFCLNLGSTSPEHAASGAAAWLGNFWRERLRAERVDDLDRPPGLPPGAVLGVLEADAARLWPALGDPGAGAQVAHVLDSPVTKARRAVGEEVPGLPSDEELARELRAEQASRRYGATQRLADKYGCSRSTIQRRTKARQALGASVFNIAQSVKKRR